MQSLNLPCELYHVYFLEPPPPKKKCNDAIKHHTNLLLLKSGFPITTCIIPGVIVCRFRIYELQ